MTDTPPPAKRAPARKAPARKPAVKKATPARKTGRPLSLTREKIDKIADLVASGIPAESAIALVGVRTSAFYKWQARGRAELERLADAGDPDGKPLASEAIYVELAEAIKRARAAAELQAITEIRVAAREGTWQAAAWFLERSNPSRWGKQYREPARDEQNGAITRAVANLVNTPLLPGENQ